MQQKQLHPESGNGAAAPPAKTKKSVGFIPWKDEDFETLVSALAAKWKNTPALTLLWTTQAAFEALAKSYTVKLQERQQTGSNRPSQTQSLKAVDADIEKATSAVKTYLADKFESEKDAIPQYARYGIIKESGTYRVPRDRDKRKNALELMKAAIASDGFGSKKYGTAFWDAITASFNNAYSATTSTSKALSEDVAAKDTHRKELETHVDALIHLIKANYPSTWESELRAWGFLKVNY